ncbi:protein-tyrosine phosphatase family protein [Candidatus Synchoanobacter obligatus]|uniref:Tyrosine specific protein phosphatases domain-containing protein n=1 Tax=Candidatus Synchoanobacter obligatus TaxID=2919597 RepID=A0ABT1L997_9GAMM|nr:protein-tyrosine phosphatase family protein [Candidatus Synchoanobacter obligatus]MCP8352648.1 hypothetical protein [Candidatus Synchoanobacter obligatus]
MALKGFRTYDLVIDAVGVFQVSAMARPSIDKFEDTLSDMQCIFSSKAEGCQGLISLIDVAEGELDRVVPYLSKAIVQTKLNHLYMTHDFADFGSPSIESLVQFRQKVLYMVQQAGPKLGVHCRAGHGRSGTMVASLYIYQCIQKTLIEDLSELLEPVSYPHKLSDYDHRSPEDMINTQYYRICVLALDFVKKQGSKPSPSSIEVDNQVRALERYTDYLCAEKREHGELKDCIYPKEHHRTYCLVTNQDYPACVSERQE